MSAYRLKIRETLARAGRDGADPRHVEAWMRSEHGTLDSLSPGRFAREVVIAAILAEASDRDTNEQLANSFGLREVTA